MLRIERRLINLEAGGRSCRTKRRIANSTLSLRPPPGADKQAPVLPECGQYSSKDRSPRLRSRPSAVRSSLCSRLLRRPKPDSSLASLGICTPPETSCSSPKHNSTPRPSCPSLARDSAPPGCWAHKSFRLAFPRPRSQGIFATECRPPIPRLRARCTPRRSVRGRSLSRQAYGQSSEQSSPRSEPFLRFAAWPCTWAVHDALPAGLPHTRATHSHFSLSAPPHGPARIMANLASSKASVATHHDLTRARLA